MTECTCGWPLPADWWLKLGGLDEEDEDEFDSADEMFLCVTCPWCGNECVCRGDPREEEGRH